MTKQNCRMAAIQMVSGPRVADNLQVAGRLIEDAVAQGAELLALPEYFPVIGAADADRVRAREDFGRGPIQDWLAATAQRHGIWIFAGSLPLTATSPDKMRNSTLVFNPAGVCVERYDKVHLFGFSKGEEFYDEAAFIEPGNDLVAVDTPFGRVALSISYDLRFPAGRAHWEILLRARAIENQCYLLAVGQGGRHESGRMTHGNSMIVDPWGEILDRKMKGPGVVIADLDHARIAEIRESLPALAHRKL